MSLGSDAIDLGNDLYDDIFNEIDDENIFDLSDLPDVAKSFEHYRSCLDAFFMEWNRSNRLPSVTVYEKFEPIQVDESGRKQKLHSFDFANYSEESLRDEHLVMFAEPVIVSKLECGNVPQDPSLGSIRLISYNHIERKVITKDSTRILKGPLDSSLITTYKIDDLVLGIILPKKCLLIAIKFARTHNLFTDASKLENLIGALQEAKESPLIAKDIISGKIAKISSKISFTQNRYETVNDDLVLSEKKLSIAESNLKLVQNESDAIRSKLMKNSADYEKVLEKIKLSSAHHEELNTEIELAKKSIEKEETRLEQMSSKYKEEFDSLREIKKEVAEANREKNLTTLDIVGHSNETSKQLKAYYWFAFFSYVGLVAMALYVYINGEDFTEILPLLDDVSAWDILISRLPLITATTLIVGGFSGTFFYLIKHIVSLNTEKMVMLKAAILAEQITNSLDCTDLDEQKILEFKRDTKIKLIMEVFSKNGQEPDHKLTLEVLKALNPK